MEDACACRAVTASSAVARALAADAHSATAPSASVPTHTSFTRSVLYEDETSLLYDVMPGVLCDRCARLVAG